MSRIVSVSLTDQEYDKIKELQKEDARGFGFTAIFRRGLFTLTKKDAQIELFLAQQKKIENMALVIDRLARRLNELEQDVAKNEKAQ